MILALLGTLLLLIAIILLAFWLRRPSALPLVSTKHPLPVKASPSASHKLPPHGLSKREVPSRDALPAEPLRKDDFTVTVPVKLKTKRRAGDAIIVGIEETAGCIHEAAHSVLRLLRGDRLLAVWYQAEPHVDPYLRKPVAGAGATVWNPIGHECECGGFVRQLRGLQPFGTRESAAGLGACAVSLRPTCGKCMRYAITYLAAVYAGCAATACYMPQYEDPGGSDYDDQNVERWFENLPWLVPYREDLISSAKALAATVVRRERKAIIAFAMLLAFQDGPVEGEEAERMLREHLVSGRLDDELPLRQGN